MTELELSQITFHNGSKFEDYHCFPKEGNNNASNAVVVRNGSVHYKKSAPVLQNLNMTVKKGTIYSLLGSSGCGKTTTLSCIVGVRKLNEGDIWVFGSRPGDQGRIVGYMPQETSLFRDFSIAETLSYFGTLHGMNIEGVSRKVNFLTELLSLPESSRRVGTLSGGQRRRVSFAVALVHDPQLLVLDEPTVGVDPLLRESIWKHLIYLSKERGVTVLNTTHYIDETKDSARIGVLRYGRLIVEQNPTELLDLYGTTSLENVVLQLCRAKANGLEEDEGMDGGSPSPELLELGRLSFCVKSPDFSQYVPPQVEIKGITQVSDSLKRMRSLVHKNLSVLFRNLLLFFFSVFAPSFLVFAACITFMHDPQDLPFGVVNHELANNSICSMEEPRAVWECDVENLSCKFIAGIPTGVINLEYYDSEEEAVDKVRQGSIWGYMIFPEDFSAFFYERASSGANVNEDVLYRSEIIVKMDQTSSTVVYRLKKVLIDRLQNFGKEILKDCGFDERQADFPLNYKTPIFGNADTKFVEYIGPGIAISTIFFFQIIAASIRYINEKKEGTFERSLIAGTKTWEILLAYGATECVMLTLQTGIVMFIITAIVGVKIQGSLILVFILFMLSGFGGVFTGLCLGSLCNEEIEAALLVLAIFMPIIFISGIIWPAEGMPQVLQYISYCIPYTLPGESTRSIFSRGWEFTHFYVWRGFASVSLYILVIFLLTICIQKLKMR